SVSTSRIRWDKGSQRRGCAAEQQRWTDYSATMAPAALSAPVLRVSARSTGTRAAAPAPAGGLRFGKTACQHSGHSGQAVLRSKVLLRPVGQRRRLALRSSVDDSKATDDKVSTACVAS
uniref:Uncharacterized protein n=1 Tax=Aegilops tauschii subsp. strangulata TaxID=200361 RepID=A0A453FR04_AEGTS